MFSFDYHAGRWRHLVFSTLWIAASITLATCLNAGIARAETNVVYEVNEATAVHTTTGIQYAANSPRNIVAEGPGRIWYTSTDGGGIGFLELLSEPGDPLVRYRNEFYGLGEISQPYDLVYDDGVVWFTLRGIRALGKIDVTTREIETFPLLSVGAAPTGIDVDPQGRVWIAQNNGRISRFDPATEAFVEFFMPAFIAATPRVEKLLYQDERNVWFTMPDGNRVVVYDSVRDRFFDYPTIEPGPTGLIIESGRVWVTANGSSRVGRFTPTTVSVWIWYDTPTPEGGPAGLLVFDDAQGIRQVWVTENKTGTIGRIQLNGFIVAQRERLGPSSPAGNPWGILRTSDEHIWIADPSLNVLYELTEPFFHHLYIASIPNHPLPQPEAQP